MDVQVSAELEYEVLEDFTLIGQVANMTLTMTDMQVYF